MNENTTTSDTVGKAGGVISGENVDVLWNNSFVDLVIKLILAVIVFVILVIVSKIISGAIKKKLMKSASVDNEEYTSKVANLVGDVFFYVLLTFSIFIGFQILGFDLTILLGGLSFGIGFAFKEILGNMLAGILVLTTKDYRIGDIIKVEGVGGNGYDYFGHIEEITIRYTSIRELSNQKVIIPNLVLITNPVKTFTSEEFVRGETNVVVNFKTDIGKVTKILSEAINNESYIVNKERTNIICNNFGTDGMNIEIRYYYDPNGELSFSRVRSRINNLILEKLRENDIDIAYPHRSLTLEKNDQNILKTILFAKKQ